MGEWYLSFYLTWKPKLDLRKKNWSSSVLKHILISVKVQRRKGRWIGKGGRGEKMCTILFPNFEFWVSPKIKITNWTVKYLIKPFVTLQLSCYQSHIINLVTKKCDRNFKKKEHFSGMNFKFSMTFNKIRKTLEVQKLNKQIRIQWFSRS